MTTFKAVFTGTRGKTKPDRISITQNSTETPAVLDCYNADGTAYIFAVGDVASASFADNSTGEVYAVTGTITPAVGASTLTWARSAEDVGTPAVYTISFKVVSTVPKTDKTIPVTYTVVPVPDGVLVPPSPLVGVSIAEAAWLSVALDTVPDASDLITSADVDNKQDKDTDATAANVAIFDANGQTVDAGFALGTAAQLDVGDFAPALGVDDNYVTDAEKTIIGNTSGTNTGDSASDPAGSAAAVQAFSIQRANHTGTQTSSTISDFAATVRDTVLTGLSTATNAVITAADTILGALGKLQAQITGHVSATGTSVHGLGTMATETTVDYYQKTDFESDPGASTAPLLADTGVIRVNNVGFSTLNGYQEGSATERIRLIADLQASASGGETYAQIYPTFSGGAFPFDEFGNIVFYGRSDSLRRGSFAVLVGITPSVAFGVRALDKAVMIGNDDPGGQFHLTVGAAGRIGQVIELATSQTANGFIIRESVADGGGTLFSIGASGNIANVTMKSGATQAAAGAAAGELWKTASHATLPDNVVLHGV